MGKTAPVTKKALNFGSEKWKLSSNKNGQFEVSPSTPKSALKSSMNWENLAQIKSSSTNNHGQETSDLRSSDHENDQYDYSEDKFESDDEFDNEDPQSIYDVDHGVGANELAKIWKVNTKEISHSQSHKQRKCSIWEKLQYSDALKSVGFQLYCQLPKSVTVCVTFTQTGFTSNITRKTIQTKKVTEFLEASVVPQDIAKGENNKHNTSLLSKRGCGIVPSLHNSLKNAHLKHFLIYAVQIIETVLKCPWEGINVSQGKIKGHDLSFTPHQQDWTTHEKMDLYDDNILGGRQLEFVYYKDFSTSMLLCGYSPSKDKSVPSARQGCLCIYNLSLSPQPIQVLALEGSPMCSCWIVTRKHVDHEIIAVGTDAGSLALWDISSRDLQHMNRDNFEPLKPSYSTNYYINHNHTSPIVSISYTTQLMDIKPIAIGNGLGMEREMLKVMTMDSYGILNSWAIKESQTLDSREDIDGDLDNFDPGQRLGGCIYLAKIGSVQVVPHLREIVQIVMPEVCLFVPFPNSTHEILVAINDGTLRRASLVDSPGSPRKYSCHLEGEAPPSLVVSACFSPFAKDCFLVAYADATLALCTTHKESPWKIWTLETSAAQVVAAQWSPVKSSVFYVLDSSNVIYKWDLSQSVENPISIERFHKSNNNLQNQRASVFEVSKCETGSTTHSFAIGEGNNHVFANFMHHIDQEGDSCGVALLKQCLAPDE